MADPPPLTEEEVLFGSLGEIARTGTLWAILDACDAPEVPSRVHRLGDAKAVSLYRGRAEVAYRAIAPYLVSVDANLLTWMRRTLWTAPWGIFAQAATDLETLRTHFRKFLLVEDSKGRRMYFRFYDPRVLRSFLRTCDDAESMEFFGPISRILLGQGGESLLAFRRTTRPNSEPARGSGIRDGAKP